MKFTKLQKIILIAILAISLSAILPTLVKQRPDEVEQEFELQAIKNDWRADETPEFEIIQKEAKQNKKLQEKLIATIGSIFGKKPKIKAKMDNPLDKELELQERKDFKTKGRGPIKITVFRPEHFTPGLHKLKVDLTKENKVYAMEKEFLWGVLAINTNKSIYLPNETAYLQMAVLRDDGRTVCNANLRLEIKNPKSEIQTLSTKEGTIQYSGICKGDNVVNAPDYFAYYQVKGPGRYEMKLINLDNGYEITDFFEVKESVPFEIERIGPTRIYPPATYEMKFKIKANQDFEGEIIEQVPSGFELKTQNLKLKTITQNSKLIGWDLKWKAGETYEIRYQFDAPDISPELFLLGPLKFEKKGLLFNFLAFEESRQWQIASDSPGINLEVPLEMVDFGLGSAAGTGITGFARTDMYLDASNYDGATYYFEIVAVNSDTSNRTVYLRDVNNAVDKVSLDVPANTTSPTRIRSTAWTPAAGKIRYRVRLQDTPTAGQLVVYTARIIVQQTNATKTRIQIPLVQRDYDGYGLAAANIDNTLSTSYTQGVVNRYSIWKKDTSVYADLAATNPWTLEAVLDQDGGYTAYAALFNKTTNSQVSGAEISVLDTTPTLTDVSFSNSAANFTEGDEFEIRIKSSYAAGTYGAELRSAARLYVSLTNLKRAEVYYRVSRKTGAGTAARYADEQRALIDKTLFSNPTIYLEATGYCADNAQRLYLYDGGTADSGTTGSTVSGSGINFNSSSKIRVRSSEFSSNLTSGNRFFAYLTASTYAQEAISTWVVIQVGEPTFSQSAYRFFNNLDSTDVGTPLATQDTPSILTSSGQAFRLRMLLHIGGVGLSQSGQQFKLQFGQKSGSVCGDDETFSDITTTTVIAYNDNSTPTDGSALTATSTDPTHGSDNIENQTYEELNNFTNSQSVIESGEDGKWDFALKDNGMPLKTIYCFRAVKSDGTALNTYTVYPEIIFSISHIRIKGNVEIKGGVRIKK